MAAKLTRLTHKIAIQLHLVAESCTICSSCSRRPVRKLFDTPSSVYSCIHPFYIMAHPASYPVGTRDTVPGGKAAREWSWRPTSM